VVAERIADGAIFGLLKQWLTAPVVEEDEHGTTRSCRGKGTRKGIPQGGVISPLLANLYLHVVDRIWARREVGQRLRAKIVRYADDRAPRRRIGGRESSVQPCCTRDGGRPLEAAVQAEASNHPWLLSLREMVVSAMGKGRARPCQVWTVESNVSEPLMTCRKRRDDVKTGGESLLRDESGGYLCTGQMASGMKAARRRSRLLWRTWEPVTLMRRETRKWRTHKRESTEARYRGGATRSSEEGSVMERERRGCLIGLEGREQPAMGGLS
jgi:hypothetical protein